MALFGASAVHAEDGVRANVSVQASVRPPIAGERGEIKDKRMEIKTQIETRKQELEAKRASSTEARIETRATKASNRIAETIREAQNRLNGEIKRLGDIKAKIDSRLVKFEQVGATTTLARADEALAVTAIAGAQTQINAIASFQVSTTATTTVNVKASTDALRQAIKAAQTAINDAQKALMKVVSDMKGLEASVKVKADVEASSSAETR